VLLLGTQPIGHAQQVFDVLDVVRHFSGVKKPPEGGGLLLCLPSCRQCLLMGLNRVTLAGAPAVVVGPTCV
jgi:hypothetical protein